MRRLRIDYLGRSSRRPRPGRSHEFVDQPPAGKAGDLSCPSTPPSRAPGALKHWAAGRPHPQNRASLHLHGGLTRVDQRRLAVSVGDARAKPAPTGLGPGLADGADMPKPGQEPTTWISATIKAPASSTCPRRHLRPHTPERATRPRPRRTSSPTVDDELVAAAPHRGRRATPHHRGQDASSDRAQQVQIRHGPDHRGGQMVLLVSTPSTCQREPGRQTVSTPRGAGTTSPGTGRATTAR